MSTFDEAIEVDVPVRTAYNQWTQFESFPEFMDGVESVTQKDDTHLRWEAEILGVKRTWDAEITEQIPDERVAWRATDGTKNAGVVTFHKLSDDKSRVMLQIEIDPEGITEKAGDALGIVKSRLSGDLKRFKDFIETRGSETGAWRGEVRND